MKTRMLGALAVAMVGCGGQEGGSADGPMAQVDASPGDTSVDAAELPISGFGTIRGDCGRIDPSLLAAPRAIWLQGELDFADDRYDDPADRPLLTEGGREVILDGNAGGSSLFSEAFAFEWLARCEGARLLKTENEISYEVAGSKRADLLVDLVGSKAGVSVTRLVTFPFGEPYTADAATLLLERKIDDLSAAATAAVPADRWQVPILSILAYDLQHADVAKAAWDALDAAVRGDTILIVTVTSGDDLFIYTDE